MSIQRIESLSHRLHNYLHFHRAGKLRARAMVRPFSSKAGAKVLLVTQPERIPQSQVFPFHYYATDLQRLYGADIREADLDSLLAGQPLAQRGANVVAFQTPFDMSDDHLRQLVTLLDEANPGARFVYLDWFSPTDLRNATRIGPLVDVYVKKHVFRDRSRYGQPTLGDTNLTDYYARRFNLPEPETCFAIPPGFLDKLLVGPSFATAPGIMPALLAKPSAARSRPIDVHARIAVNGTPWYQAMRLEADTAVGRLSGLNVVRGSGVPSSRFMAEIHRTKICFSPFGYGEVCWRDYEAAMGGAVLLKPDMGHVETAPDIFVPWETYVPLAWDLSDLEDKVRQLISDEALRTRLAHAAFAVLHDWLRSDAFARTMEPLFD